MKRLVLLAIALVAITQFVSAQGDNPGNCGFSFVVEDGTCGDGCVSNTFTAPTTDSGYCLYCQMVRCSGNYGDCHANMTLSRSSDGAIIATCDNLGNDHCDSPFPASQCSLTLQQGVQYKLTVCLNGCPPGYNCSNCVDCVARAQVCRPS